MANKNRATDLLAAYGADVNRWPAAERSWWMELAPDVRQALAREDQALDQLLSMAQTTIDDAPPSDDLMARIMASASSDQSKSIQQAQSDTSPVVPLEPRPVTEPKPSIQTRREWPAAAALLAASLLLGIFVGSMEQVQSTAARMSDIAGLNIAPAAVQTSALDETWQTQDDEDIL